MEDKKSYNLPSVGWKRRKTGGIIQYESEAPRTMIPDM